MQTSNPARQRAALLNTRSRQTRQVLLRAALGLWSEGDFDEAYESSTPADIARAAGVSKGTFYFHFASKDDVLLEMSAATVLSMIEEVDKGMSRSLPLLQLNRRVMTSMARRISKAPRAATLRVVAIGFGTQPTEGTPERPRVATAFEKIVRYGKDRGELDAKADVEDVAAMLTAVTMDGVLRWSARDRPPAWLRQALCRRTEIVIRGVGATEVPPGRQPAR